MYLRKIQRIGLNRKILSVTIPKEFCDKISIKGGDYVKVSLSENIISFFLVKIKEETTESNVDKDEKYCFESVEENLGNLNG